MSINKLPKPADLKQAVIHYEQDMIKPDQIRLIARVWPKATPLEGLKTEKLEPNEKWGKAELYMKQLLDPPSIHARIKMWRFRVDWDDEKAIQIDSVQVQSAMYDQLQNNKYIQKILSMALAIGNILNGDSPKG